MTSVTLDQIVFDDSIYPRAKWSQATVDRYADALQGDAHFPPIILEAGTHRLLDGKHRCEAYRAAGRKFVAVDFHEIPEGIPAKLYAAKLSSTHGDPIKADEKRQVAREIASENPEFSVVLIAGHLGISRQSAAKYVGDIVERRREVRVAKAALLSRSGKSVREVAELLGVSKSEVSRNVADDNPGHLTEGVLREAAAALPIDATPIVDEILRERCAPSMREPQPDPQTRESAGAVTAPPADSGPAADEPETRPAATNPEPSTKPEPAVSDRMSDEETRKSAERQRDARDLLRRIVDLAWSPRHPEGHVEAWAKLLGPYDEELSELCDHARKAIAVLDELIEGAGQ